MKSKMRTNELVIAKGDKGKARIILTQEEYKQKTKAFIQDNQFITINNSPAQCYQGEIKQTLKQCVNIIQKKTMEIHTLESHAPSMHATIKVHKPNTPIRPIIK
jgi:hypothetical protein